MNVNQQQFESATQEILRHIEDAATSKLAHFKISDRNQTLERKLQLVSAVSFAGIVVFWFVSTQLYSIIEAFGGSVGPAWRTTTQNAIPIGFAMANVIATTFLYLYRFGEKAHQHREAAQRYHRLWRKCLNYSTECPDISSADDLARLAVSYRQELNEINHSSPDIEEWAWKTVDSEIAKGGLEYDINKKADKSES